MPLSLLERFSDQDWHGYAGATSFADGSRPFIAVVKIADWPAEFARVETSKDSYEPIDSLTLLGDRSGINLLVDHGNQFLFSPNPTDREFKPDEIAIMAYKVLSEQPLTPQKIANLGLRANGMKGFPCQPLNTYRVSGTVTIDVPIIVNVESDTAENARETLQEAWDSGDISLCRPVYDNLYETLPVHQSIIDGLDAKFTTDGAEEL